MSKVDEILPLSNSVDHSVLRKYKNNPVGYADVVVPFHDIDLVGVAWHGHYTKYFELARCAVLQVIDYDYPQMKESEVLWPIVDLRLRYVSAAEYGDRLTVAAVIVEWDLRLVIRYFVINSKTEKVTTKGQSVQVPVDGKTGALMLGCPDILEAKIDSWKQSMKTGR